MIAETRNTAPSYSALLWLIGAPVATDVAPTNAASVAVARTITTPPGIFVTPGLTTGTFAAGPAGTSCTARVWWLDDAQDLWVPHGNVFTLTSDTTNSNVQTVGCMPGCKFFLQVVTNAGGGGVTKIAFTLR